jgi:hypothetical protein
MVHLYNPLILLCILRSNLAFFLLFFKPYLAFIFSPARSSLSMLAMWQARLVFKVREGCVGYPASFFAW